MPSAGSLAAFAALSFALIVVPGPSVMFVVSRGVTLGRRAALLTVVGNAAGIFLQVLLVAAGLAIVVERSAEAFTVIKLLGAGYLVWLGYQAIRHRRQLSASLGANDSGYRPRTVLLDGFVVGFANPKSIVFFAAILPQYVSSGGAPSAVQMAILGSLFVVIALVLDSLWGVAAGTARTWLVRTPHRVEHLGFAGGLVMVGLGIQLAVTGRRD